MTYVTINLNMLLCIDGIDTVNIFIMKPMMPNIRFEKNPDIQIHAIITEMGRHDIHDAYTAAVVFSETIPN